MTDNVVSCSLILTSNSCSPSNHTDAFIFHGLDSSPYCRSMALICGEGRIQRSSEESLSTGADYFICKIFVISCGGFVTSSCSLISIRLHRQASASGVSRRHSNGNDDLLLLCPCWCGRNNLRKMPKSLLLSGSLQYKKELSCSAIDSRQAERFGPSKKV